MRIPAEEDVRKALASHEWPLSLAQCYRNSRWSCVRHVTASEEGRRLKQRIFFVKLIKETKLLVRSKAFQGEFILSTQTRQRRAARLRIATSQLMELLKPPK